MNQAVVIAETRIDTDAFPSHLPQSLGERLRWLRRQHGLTQEQLAKLADTSQAVLQKIENGKSLRPRKIDLIAAALDTTPAWLMFGEKDMTDLSETAREIIEKCGRLTQSEQEHVLGVINMLLSH